MSEPLAERPDCYRCRAFYVTYQPEHPYGCRTFHMKSRLLPSFAVRNASGNECHAFDPKDPPRRPAPGSRFDTYS